MRNFAYRTLAIGVLGLIGGSAAVITQDRWSLVVEVDSGDQFVVDHDMTRGDCAARSKEFLSYPLLWCEREKVLGRR